MDTAAKERIVYELLLNGYALLPQFLPPDLVAGMLAQVQPIHDAEAHRILTGDGEAARCQNRLCLDLKPYIKAMRGGPLDDDRFRRNPEIDEIADAVLGRWRRGCTKAECPLEGSGYMGWHPDMETFTAETLPREPYRTTRLTLNIALVDIDEGNGPMEIIPGSHRMFHDGRRPHEGMPVHSVPMLMKAGDAFLRDGNGLHRGTPNRTGRPRILLDQTCRAIHEDGTDVRR